MEFKTVYKVKGLHGDFVEKEELDELVRSAEEHKLLYFLKENNYKIFHDCPAIGTYRRVLTHSAIKGPFASHPKVSNTRNVYYDQVKEVIKKVIPAAKVPKSFEGVELTIYGLREELIKDVLRIINFDFGRVREIVDISIGNMLIESSQDLDIDNDEYGTSISGVINDCKIDFYYSEKGVYFPFILSLTAFGRKGKTHELIEQIGLNELGKLDVFKKDHLSRDLGLECCVQEGLAYDLSIKDVDLEKLDICRSKNIILDPTYKTVNF